MPYLHLVGDLRCRPRSDRIHRLAQVPAIVKCSLSKVEVVKVRVVMYPCAFSTVAKPCRYVFPHDAVFQICVDMLEASTSFFGGDSGSILYVLICQFLIRTGKT